MINSARALLGMSTGGIGPLPHVRTGLARVCRAHIGRVCQRGDPRRCAII